MGRPGATACHPIRLRQRPAAELAAASGPSRDLELIIHMRSWWILAAVVVLGGGTATITILNNRAPAFDVTEVAIESRPMTMSIETSGTIEPLSTVEVGCEVSGKIVELTVDHDDPVTKGQILCKIDPELMAKELEQARADYLKAAAALADAKLARDEQIANLPVRTQQALAQKQEAEAALVDAEYNWKRVEDLYRNQNASEAELVLRKSAYLRSQSALTAAEAAYKLSQNNEKILVHRAHEAVAQAEATVKLAQARMDFAATRVDRCVIRSPIDGIVLRRFMDAGQTVTAAFQTPVLFLLSPSLKRMRVNAKVSESDISHIEVGQRAHFTIEAKRPTLFEGRILHKRNQPDIIQNVVTYTVSFEVDNPEGVLIPGLSVNVVIECVAKEALPVIPNAALRFKPPLTTEQRQELIAAAQWPDRPTLDALGRPAVYCSKVHAWRFDPGTLRWSVVPLWAGITDNVDTEVLAGAKVGERVVKKFVDRSSGGFSFKEALKLASPYNRTL